MLEAMVLQNKKQKQQNKPNKNGPVSRKKEGLGSYGWEISSPKFMALKSED
jgi:hypothetical protein